MERQRRSRMKPQSSGKKVKLGQRDLLWFSKLLEHGPLSSRYLYAFSQRTHKSEKRVLERLTDLFHENNALHKGPYLSRPVQQFRTIDSRNNHLIYDLTPASLKLLNNEQISCSSRDHRSGPWLHQYLVACITSSIDIATLKRAEINYIPQSKILNRANTSLSIETQFKYPNSRGLIRKTLIPDAMFGLEYLKNGKSYYRFFAIEADRGTEPISSKNFNRKSYVRNLLQYQDLIENQRYRAHFALTAPMIALFVFSEAKKRDAMMKLVTKLWPQGKSYLCFGVIDGFDGAFKPLGPQAHLLELAWRRAGMATFNISQI